MYRCEDCGHIFEEPYHYREPDVGYGAYWCPSCHSDDITEVRECKICGEYAPVHDLTIDGYCPACVRSAARKFDALLSSQFEKEELEILKEQFGIEPISY